MTGADAEDRDVLRALDFLQHFVVVQLAERVDSIADEDDVFLSFDAFQPVDGVIKCIEQVRLTETRNAQLSKRSHHLILVLSEVNQQVGSHVVGFNRDPIFLLHLSSKGVRGIEGIHHEVIIVRGELDEQNRRDRLVSLLRESVNLLRNTVLDDLEIVLLQAGNELAVAGDHTDRKIHQRHIYFEGERSDFFRILHLGGAFHWLFFFRRLLGHGDWADVALRSSRFRRDLLLRSLRLLALR